MALKIGRALNFPICIRLIDYPRETLHRDASREIICLDTPGVISPSRIRGVRINRCRKLQTAELLKVFPVRLKTSQQFITSDIPKTGRRTAAKFNERHFSPADKSRETLASASVRAVQRNHPRRFVRFQTTARTASANVQSIYLHEIRSQRLTRESLVANRASSACYCANRYAAGSGTLCLSRGRFYVIGEFGGVSVPHRLNGVLGRATRSPCHARALRAPGETLFSAACTQDSPLLRRNNPEIVTAVTSLLSRSIDSSPASNPTHHSRDFTFFREPLDLLASSYQGL